MNTCGNCCEQVENNAEVCPYCGGNPFKGTTMLWGWIVLAVILFLIFGYKEVDKQSSRCYYIRVS